MKINKVLVANRGEIAIRVFRSCVELGLRTVGVYTYEDRYSEHRYKADEAYLIGDKEEPLKPYLDIEEIVQLAVRKGVDAIHPGYGFLSENPEFARKCRENGIVFIGPSPEIIESLGDKVSAKKIAKEAGVPVIESNQKELTETSVALEEAERIGYPVMLKAVSGGGGRGMRVIRTPDDLESSFEEARNEARNAFGDESVFIEKYIEEPKHLEVQIVGDQHGDYVHLYERDCSVQRRYQKVVEFAPSYGLSDEVRQELYDHAKAIAGHIGYNNIGTVEFLVGKNGEVVFIEVNPRIQVEHTVTEMVTNIDLVKTQLFIADGYPLDSKQVKIPSQDVVKTTGYAIQCRITTEDPENDFQPDYGIITTYRSAGGFGIRLDVGSVYQGVRVSPFFDPMLVKVSAHSRTLEGATRKMDRTLMEFRIRGVKTNMQFLQNIIGHEKFINGEATVNFVGSHPELFRIKQRQDRATRIVSFLGDVIVNGNPDVKTIDPNKRLDEPEVPAYDKYKEYPKGSKDLLDELGPEGFAQWLKDQKKVQFTDTTFRDAHQSVLATRMRTYDMLRVAESYAKNIPQVFSMESWGGATFDVCLRFLHENPWRRIREIKQAMPNMCQQMLLRGSNAVGYTAYPDNLIASFVEKAWENGVDIFRIFDSLNWMKAMGPSIEFVRERTNGIAEGAISYTGDILDPNEDKFTLDHYLQLAKDLENAGSHILAIKDMAGLLKPYAAKEFVSALKDTVDIPIHLHTHDTSSLQPATYMQAIEAGVDAVDVALGGMSGLTSQPNFNSVLAMLEHHERGDKDIDTDKLDALSNYFELVREYYYPFETELKAGTAEVFKHEIPGGQYSNLKPQAVGLGLGNRFEEIKKRYREVNEMFGRITKVTPSSKVVGDMALFMVSNDLTPEDVFEKGEELSFPESVESFFRGDLGQPPGGFPEKLQKIVLKGKKPYTDRPNDHLDPVDLDGEFEEFKERFQGDFPRNLEYEDYLSWKLYPKVFEQALEMFKKYGDVSRIPTKNFLFGMEENEETIISIAEGKDIIVQLLSVGPANEDGTRTVFFKVNGQTRNVDIDDRALEATQAKNPKKDPDDPDQIGPSLQGKLSRVLVENGQKVEQNEALFVIEAMKMETTITAPKEATVEKVHLEEGTMVDGDDLVVTLG